MRTIIKISVYLMLLCVLTLSTSHAFWIFTPKDQKTVDPKASVKDTPEAQYEFAMNLYNKKNYRDAGDAFVRLVEHWKDSSVTPDAQYYAAVAYQKADRPYIAFNNYEKVIKYYPFSKRIDDIVKAEYDIGMLFYERSEAMLMGVELMGEVERAIEIFSAIIEHMPYSSYADNAQFMIGMSYKKLHQYNESVAAFEKVVQEYPKSKLVDRAKYEIAQAMSIASKDSDYDQQTTDEAIEKFKQYSEEIKSEKVKEEAKITINRLREKKAKSIYDIAFFYERMKKYRAAYIYYSQVFNEYKDTTYSKLAKEKLDKKINPLLAKQEAKELKLKQTAGVTKKKDQQPKKAWWEFYKKDEQKPEDKTFEKKEEVKDAARDNNAEAPSVSITQGKEEKKKAWLDFNKKANEKPKTQEPQKASTPKVKKVKESKPLLDFRKKDKEEKNTEILTKENKVTVADEATTKEETKKAKPLLDFRKKDKEENKATVSDEAITKEETKKSKPLLDFRKKDSGKKDEPKKKKSNKPFSFFGYTTGSLIYKGAKTIYVDNFKNEIDFTKEVTNKSMYVAYRSGIETDVTRAIIDRFLFDGHLNIEPDNKADLILDGALKQFKKEAIRYDNNDNVIEYRLEVYVSYSITARDTGEVLLNEKHFAGETTYRTTGTYAKTEQQAIAAAIADLALRVVNSVVETW